jgi:hypothetical protein
MENTKVVRTQGSCTVHAARHGKQTFHSLSEMAETFGNESDHLIPRQDTVVQVEVSHRDAINARLLLLRPSLLLDVMRHLEQLVFSDQSLPMFFQSKLEFAVGSHARKSKGGGGEFHVELQLSI